MANETQKPAATEPQPTPLAYAALIAGWILPGAGHLLLRRWVRGLLLFASIVSLFLLGVAMQGKVYSINAGDLLDILGFVGDLGAGALYFLARSLDWGTQAIQQATGDYGSKFIVVAGLLNIISAIDAWHIALGKKK
jgi:hypothetical protein